MVMINTGITKAMRKAARFLDLLPVELQGRINSMTAYATELDGGSNIVLTVDRSAWQKFVDHIGRDNGAVEEEAVQESDTLLTQHRSFLVDGIDVCTNWTEVIGG